MTTTRKEVLENLVEQLKTGQAFYFRGIQDKELEDDIFPSGKSFGKLWKHINHVGSGCFFGKTPHGEVSFSGGGALIHLEFNNGDYLRYSAYETTPEVLEAIKYPFERVITALEKEIATL
jgi:hypothetical protein